VIAGLIGTTLLGVSAYLASGCSDHPDAVANRFYTRLAALDIGGMAQLVCEDERLTFRESVAFVESIPRAKPLELEEFDARTERSDGTAVAMRVSARFVDTERGEEMEVSTRVRLIRKDGEWCISGEGDGFRSVSESAADVFALLVRGGISRGRGFDFPEDARSIPVQVVTPPPAGLPEVEGEIMTTESGLQYVEIEVGTGPAPRSGQELLVHYTLWLEASGEQIDTSLDGGPFEFALGEGMVIAGWDEGLATMREGGMRRLIVPPKLAYGDAGQGLIPPNATLVFDVELVEVR
jgi:peptidylprolyl isomerase